MGAVDEVGSTAVDELEASALEGDSVVGALLVDVENGGRVDAEGGRNVVGSLDGNFWVPGIKGKEIPS